ncbi:hypothetical protein GCM10028807_40910 [Spirosoma daeguense]
MATTQAQYTKTQQGNGYVFYVTPASVPKSIFLLFVVGIPSFVLITLVFSMTNSIIYKLIVLALVWYVFKWALSDRRPKNHHNPSTFMVTSDYVDVNGKRFAKSDIHAILTQNIYNDNAPNMAYMTSNQQMGAGVREESARVSYALNLESGGRPINWQVVWTT